MPPLAIRALSDEILRKRTWDLGKATANFLKTGCRHPGLDFPADGFDTLDVKLWPGYAGTSSQYFNGHALVFVQIQGLRRAKYPVFVNCVNLHIGILSPFSSADPRVAWKDGLSITAALGIPLQPCAIPRD